MPLVRLTAVVLVLGALVAGCTSEADPAPNPTGPSGAAQLNASLATSDHYVGAPQRVSIGLQTGSGEIVTFGSVDVSFSYLGTAAEPVDPEPGPSGVAVYLPTPGTPDRSGGPVLSLPSDARGVYQVEDVTFDRAGFWQVDVTADVEGVGDQRARTNLAVLEEPAYPAPGDPALETENLTLDSEDAPLRAIDSRAVNTGRVPDPALHRSTIADAVRQGHPALVVFATPVYCISQFCGPVTDLVEDLETTYADRAAFIHVEIWRDYRDPMEAVMNQAAADWLLQEDGGFTEPWLYLIGADGRIVDRWATLWRQDEVATALEALPPIEA